MCWGLSAEDSLAICDAVLFGQGLVEGVTLHDIVGVEGGGAAGSSWVRKTCSGLWLAVVWHSLR